MEKITNMCFHAYSELHYTIIQLFRFIRYNFFPVKCPGCKEQIVLKQNAYAYEIKNNNIEMNMDEKLSLIVRHTLFDDKICVCDYVYCLKCEYVKNLDKEAIENE